MKKIFYTLFLTLLLNVAYSQTFQVVDDAGIEPVEYEKYKLALEKANMDNYRNKTRNQIIEFDNGLKIELFSAKELVIRGYSINVNEFTDERDPKFTFPTFHLTDTGDLLAFYKPTSK